MLGDAAEASGHEPKLGGPTEATLADALTYYANQWTVNKGGARAELNRINHYLSAAGEKRLRLHVDPKGTKSVVEDTAALAHWQHHYNCHRPHSAIGGMPPISRLSSSGNNLLTLQT